MEVKSQNNRAISDSTSLPWTEYSLSAVSILQGGIVKARDHTLRSLQRKRAK